MSESSDENNDVYKHFMELSVSWTNTYRLPKKNLNNILSSLRNPPKKIFKEFLPMKSLRNCV